MNKTIKSTAMLCCAAIIWGSAFVAQRSGMDSIGPFYFCAFRALIGSISLFIVAFFVDRRAASQGAVAGENSDGCSGENSEGDSGEGSHDDSRAKRQEERRLLLRGGILCGLFVFFAMNTQQMGLVSVDAGKTGFITALYIILVPILGIFLKKKTGLTTWLGAGFGVVGLYFLCVKGGFSVQPADMLIAAGTLFWALQILCVDHYAPKVSAIKLTAVQFFTAGIISLVIALFRESLTWEAISGAGIAILYTAIPSTAIAFTLQAAAQKHANPTVAAIIMSTEGLWAVIFGFLILGEVMTSRELIGCGFMLCAVILSQLPVPGARHDEPESPDAEEQSSEHSNEKEINNDFNQG